VKVLKRLCATVLIMEAVVIGLSIPVAVQVDHLPPGSAATAGGVAAVAAVAVLFALLTYGDQPAQDRSAPWDFVALGLAVCGCTAAFFGAAKLESGSPPGQPAPGSAAGRLRGLVG